MENKFSNLIEAIQWLENEKKDLKRSNLERIKTVLNDFHNPHLSFKTIHISGTNGKGSVNYILSNVLKNECNVGTFTSPYITCFNERIKINDINISDDILLNYINKVYPYAIEYKTKYMDTIPFFELCFLISMLYFKDSKIDIAIIETGIGGLLDATNVFSNKIAVITNIGFDHMNSLGNTLESIASHKLGIVKENDICYSSVDDNILDFFNNYLNNINVKHNHITIKDCSDIKLSLNEMSFVYNNYHFKTTLIGIHQISNIILCINILNKEFNISYESINKVLNKLSFNARFEIVKKKPTVILDGAHNLDGINALIKTLELMNKKVHFVFTALQDKEFDKMLERLKKVAFSIVLTKLDYYRGSNLKDFKNESEGIYYNDSINDIISLNNYKDDDIVVFTGSLYFISEVRKYFK